jgi:hypothetical protein
MEPLHGCIRCDVGDERLCWHEIFYVQELRGEL